MSLKHLHIRGQ